MDHQEQLEAAAEHVAHDVRMLAEAYKHRADRFAYTAWFVFCRSLTEFLSCFGHRDDDVTACAFTDDPELWPPTWAALEKPQDFDEWRVAVNKLAAHLTFRRVEYAREGDRWAPSAEITTFLISAYKRFLSVIPDDRREWFRTRSEDRK